MKFFTKNYLWILFAAIAIAEIGYLAYLGPLSRRGLDNGRVENVAVEIIQPLFGEISPSIKAILQPDLAHVANPPTRQPEFYRVAMQEKIASAKAILRETPYDFYQWSVLALLYENFDDYSEAREIWEYLLKVEPENPDYLGNLGQLYHYQFKDYPKAETLYLKAIEGDAKRTDIYIELYDLYRYLYPKSKTASLGILKSGVKENPSSLELLVALAYEYRDRGDKKNAELTFDSAIGESKLQGDYDKARQLESERDKL